jgi:hypothetical protein
MVFNATFNNTSVISWRSVLLMEETGVPGETTDLSQFTDKSSIALHDRIRTHNVSGDRHRSHVQVVLNPTTIRLRRPLTCSGLSKYRTDNGSKEHAKLNKSQTSSFYNTRRQSKSCFNHY